jgi:hypothetical protein
MDNVIDPSFTTHLLKKLGGPITLSFVCQIEVWDFSIISKTTEDLIFGIIEKNMFGINQLYY